MLSSRIRFTPASSADANVVERLGLDLETQPRRRLAEPRHGLGDAADEPQMVVLDEERLAEVEPVIGPAAAADGVLLEIAQAGRGLAGVQQRGTGAVQLGDAAGGQRCDPGEAAEQV